MSIQKKSSSLEIEEREGFCFLAGVICFVGFLLGIETGGLQFVLLKIAREFGLSQMSMGSLMSVQFIAVTAAPLLVGALSDRIGKKIVIIVGCLIFALSAALCICAETVVLLQIGICGIGVAFGALEATITGALSDSYPGNSGKYLTVMQGFLSLGAVLGPVFVNFTMIHWGAGWRMLFWLCAICALLAGILCCWGTFKTVEPEKTESGSFKIIDRVLIGAMVLIFLYLFVENGVTCFMDTFFATILDEPGYSAAALSAFWAAMAISRMVTSLFYDRRNILIPVMCLAAAVLLIGLKVTNSPSAAFLVFGAVGLCYGPLSPFLINIAVQRNPKKSGTVAGFMLAASGLGGAASPVVAGCMADFAGLRAAYCFIGLMVLVEMGCYLKFMCIKK